MVNRAFALVNCNASPGGGCAKESQGFSETAKAIIAQKQKL
jgi:hypothetical protein